MISIQFTWLTRVAALTDGLPSMEEPEARRKEAQLRREFETIADDALLDEACTLLDHLYAAYAHAASKGGTTC